jgi:hypothetical protein
MSKASTSSWNSARGQPLLLTGGAERIPGDALSFAAGQDHRFGALYI